MILWDFLHEIKRCLLLGRKALTNLDSIFELLNCGVGEDAWESSQEIKPGQILKEISPEFSLEGLMWKLKLQYFAHLMWRTDSFEKTLMLGKIEGMKRRGQQTMRWLDGIIDSNRHRFEQTLGDGEGQEVWCATAHGVEKSGTWLNDWTTFY